MSPVMDIACNLRLDTWSSYGCHGNMDKVLTPTGDTAVISGEWNLLKQHIVIWVATPLGEDPDPKIGCILHKYEFRKAVVANYKVIEMELKANLEYNFPEYYISNVRVIGGFDEVSNTHGIVVSARFNSEEVAFFTNSEKMLDLWRQMRQSLGSLAYITDAKG